MSGEVLACRGASPQRLSHAVNVVRFGTATDAEVVNSNIDRFLGELRNFVPVAGKRIERGREGAAIGQAAAVLVMQMVEGGFCIACSVGHGKRSHVAFHSQTNLSQHRATWYPGRVCS